jgi:hypothetical protein
MSQSPYIRIDPQILPDTGGALDPGKFYFSNDSRFVETFFQEPLTTYALGFRDPNDIAATLELLAPEVPCGRRFHWKKATNAEEFLSETVDDARAIGSDFKRIQYTGTEQYGETRNKGLTFVVDLDQTQPGWEENVTARILRRLMRNELRRAFALVSASAVNTAKTWGSSADPDGDLMTELVASTDISGIRPNRIMFGDTAWTKRFTAYRAQDNAGAYSSSGMTPQDLASLLMVDRIGISRERFQSSASAKSQIVGDKVLIQYGDAMANEEDPSHIKRFVTVHDAQQGGGRFSVYRQQLGAKTVAISVGYYSSLVATYTGGIRQLTIS